MNNKFIIIAEVSALQGQVANGHITYSRYVEILNEKAKLYAIEVCEELKRKIKAEMENMENATKAMSNLKNNPIDSLNAFIEFQKTINKLLDDSPLPVCPHCKGHNIIMFDSNNELCKDCGKII